MKIGELTIEVDTRAKAIYIYLRPRGEGFHACSQDEPMEGVIVDLDSSGHAIGLELLGPGKLQVIVKTVVQKYHVPALKQILPKRKYIEEMLAASS